MEFKTCSNQNCKNQNPQHISNFSKNKRTKDGFSSQCLKCMREDKRKRKELRKEIQRIKNSDDDQFNTTIACCYILGFHESRLLKLFDISKEKLFEVVNSEMVYEYHVCKKCGKLKHFTEYFKKTKNSLQPKCKICVQDEHSKDEKLLLSRRNHQNKLALFQRFSNRLSYAEDIFDSHGYLMVKCAYCGQLFCPTNSQVYLRINALESDIFVAENRFYCSDNCKQECPIYMKRVDSLIKEDAAKSGRIQLNREVQAELRQLVFARDNYTCQKCGKQNVRLNAHHVEGLRWEPLESADIDKCLTVCVDCHKKIHQIPGCGYNDMKCNAEDM